MLLFRPLALVEVLVVESETQLCYENRFVDVDVLDHVDVYFLIFWALGFAVDNLHPFDVVEAGCCGGVGDMQV